MSKGGMSRLSWASGWEKVAMECWVQSKIRKGSTYLQPTKLTVLFSSMEAWCAMAANS